MLSGAIKLSSSAEVIVGVMGRPDGFVVQDFLQKNFAILFITVLLHTIPAAVALLPLIVHMCYAVISTPATSDSITPDSSFHQDNSAPSRMFL